MMMVDGISSLSRGRDYFEASMKARARSIIAPEIQGLCEKDWNIAVPACAGLRSSRPQRNIAVRMTANPAPARTPVFQMLRA
jgi:hypothetical protein